MHNKLPDELQTEDAVVSALVQYRETQIRYNNTISHTTEQINRLRSGLELAKRERTSILQNIAFKIHGYLNKYKSLFKSPRSKILKYGDIPIAKIGFHRAGGKLLIEDRDAAIEWLKTSNYAVIVTPVTTYKIDIQALKTAFKNDPNLRIPGISVTPICDDAFFDLLKCPDPD